MRMRKMFRFPALALACALAASFMSLVVPSTAGAASTTTLTVQTDSTWTVDGTSSFAAEVSGLSCTPPQWTTALAPAAWIWATASCWIPGGESHSFAKTFSLPDTVLVTAATVSFAADNGGTVTVNGHPVLTLPVGDIPSNYESPTTVDVTNYVHGGTNTIVLTGTNYGSQANLNPAGVVASASVTYEFAPTSTSECKSGGWESYHVFTNQGDCVSYVATGGKNAPGFDGKGK